MHIVKYQMLSPIDELQHVDYIYKASEGELVGRGDLVGDEAMREQACRGIDAPGYAMECRRLGSYKASQFQEGGQNTAYIHSPVYYFVTAWIGKAVVLLTPVDNLMTAARLLGPMWVLLALVLLVPTMRILGAGFWVRIAAAVLGATAPMVLHATATVNPDATALLGGSLVLCVPLLLAERWKHLSGHVADGLAAAAAMALKPSNLVVLIAGVWMRIDLVLGSLDDQESATQSGGRFGWRTRLLRATFAVVPLLLGAGLASVMILVLQAKLAQKGSDDIVMLSRFTVPTFPWEFFAQSFFSTGEFSSAGASSNYLAPVVRSGISIITSATVALGSLVVTVLAAFRTDRTSAIARSVLVATVLGGPVLIAVNFFLQGIYVPIPSRYYMSLIPGVVIVGAVTVGRWRYGAHALAALAAAWVGALALALVTAQ